MATVRDFKVKPGQMFGGKGVAVFRPFPKTQSRSETNGLTPEELLASEVESAVMQLTSDSQQKNTERQRENR
jgi:hypothetical protein